MLRTKARLLACALLCALCIQLAIAEETSPILDPDSSSTLSAEDFSTARPLEQDGLRTLWEALSTPEKGDIIRIRDRDHIDRPSAERYHYLHLERQNIELLLMESGQIATPEWRRIHSALGIHGSSTNLLIGHFRANLGEGWTVQSSPSFALTSSPMSPFYHAAEGFTANSSAEALRGWFGGAVHVNPWKNGWAPSIDLWAGSLEYEAKIGLDGYHLFTDVNRFQLRRYGIGEFQTGAALAKEFNEGDDRVQLIRSQSQFNAELTPMTSARYRFTQHTQAYGATGLAYRHTGKRLLLNSEMSYQDHDALGGSVATAYKTSQSGTFTGHTYRATRTFATLHARPYLPFGEDPTGKTGIQVGWIGKGLGFKTIAINIAQERTESETVNSYHFHQFYSDYRTYPYQFDKEKMGGWLTLQRPLGHGFDVQVRGSVTLRNDLVHEPDSLFHNPQRGEIGYGRHSIRATLTHRSARRTIHLRYQYVFAYQTNDQEIRSGSNISNGYLLSTQIQTHLKHGIDFSITGSYLRTEDWNSRVTIVETSAPGTFPFITLSGEHLRLAGRLELIPWKGVILWTSGYVDHDFDHHASHYPYSNMYDNPKVGWGFGFDWRPVF
ncbi:hypothetical protein KQI63_11205 [bacterium]|nr:hypothetical protein [bacterium]